MSSREGFVPLQILPEEIVGEVMQMADWCSLLKMRQVGLRGLPILTMPLADSAG
jgi:hypothetical protein